MVRSKIALIAGLALLSLAIPAHAAVPGKTQFFPNGPQAWFARYHLLKSAQHSILAQYFIVSDDVFGESFLELLLEKAKAGLEVKLMVDARGSFSITHSILGRALLRELIKVGAEVKTFNPFLAEGLTGSFVSSDHQKIILVDDRYFMTGGRNISQEYFLEETDLPKTFFDADILVDSPALAPAVRRTYFEEFNSGVAHAQEPEGTFGNIIDHAPRLEASLRAMEDRLFHIGLRPETIDTHPELGRWIFMREFEPFVAFHGCDGCHNESFDDVDYGPTTPELQTLNPVTLVRNTASVTTGARDLSAALLRLINESREEILIQNPYLVLPEPVKQALEAASRRGVKVIISTNGPFSGDNQLVTSAFLHDWRTLARDVLNSAIFVYRGFRQVHAKCFVFDRSRALVGSYNLDNLSDHINSEIGVIVESPAFAKRVADSIREQMELEALGLSLDENIGPERIPGAAGVMRHLRGLYDVVGRVLRPLL